MTCDHCGHEITEAETYWEITNQIIPYSYGRHVHYPLCKDIVGCWTRWDAQHTERHDIGVKVTA